jgi:hypothetical protein
MDDVEVVDKEDLGCAHTRAREVRGEVLTNPERRRSLEEKLRILAQSVAPEFSGSLHADISETAKRATIDWLRK